MDVVVVAQAVAGSGQIEEFFLEAPLFSLEATQVLLGAVDRLRPVSAAPCRARVRLSVRLPGHLGKKAEQTRALPGPYRLRRPRPRSEPVEIVVEGLRRFG